MIASPSLPRRSTVKDSLTVGLPATATSKAPTGRTTKQNVSLHAKNIFEEGELAPEATVKESLTVQTEGKRDVQRSIQIYNLDINGRNKGGGR